MEKPKIITEYKNVYFIYKPPFWNCVTGNDYLSVKKYNKNNLILDWIKNNLKIDDEINYLEFGYGLLNRLDMETSGIIMVAKNLNAYNKYRKNINEHTKTTKIYITLVEGETEHEFGVISSNLFYDKSKRTTYVDRKNGKFSYTEYVKLKTLTYKNKTYSLLLVKIKTGRTHQIRVHLYSIGHNIFCDKKYQNDNGKLKTECEISKRLFLHAMYYKIENDVDGYVKIPEDLSKTIDKMKTKKTYIIASNAFDLLNSNILTNNLLKSLNKL